MKKFLEEFKSFAMRGKVMDLAVGVIIGAAFTAIVNSAVSDLISPILGLLFKVDLSNLVLNIQSRGVAIRYGAFLTAVINFLIVAFAVFCLVKSLNVLMSIGKRDEEEKEESEKECPYCCSKISIKAVKCPFCASEIEKKEEK